jgi:DNA-binding beta-propeller fold protein YncE
VDALGQGEFAYETVEGWGALPPEIKAGDIVAVAVDEDDRVHVFTRGPHPMLVFGRDGTLLRTWGHGLFKRPHGLQIGPGGTLLATDDGDSCVWIFSLDGAPRGVIGEPGAPAPFMSGAPFHRCTHTALSPRGEIYVADGYGNACVHKFAPDGRHLKSWGESGTGAGQFYIPHNICCDAAGLVYVADRENHRIQVFDPEGRYQTEFRGVHRPCAMCLGGAANPSLIYVGEVGPAMRATLGFPNLGPRLSVLDARGRILARIGDPQTGPFVAPHGIAVDSHGDIYVADLARVAWPELFPGEPIPADVVLLHKLRRRST